MKIENLTPHTINIYDELGNEVLVIPASGFSARIQTKKTKTGEVNGISLFKTEVLGSPELVSNVDKSIVKPFPELSEDTIYVVSGLFRSEFNRSDCYQPGEAKRDDAGKIVGSVGLSQ